MSLIDSAGSASAWRGYDYYKKGKVLSCAKTDDGRYEGRVSGRDGAVYQVSIDPAHPRTSKCTCPHAAGKRIVCKHMAALYFTAFPEEAKAYYRAVLEAEEQAEREREELENAVLERVGKMKKAELRQTLLELLFNSPDWLLKRFAEGYTDLY